MHRTLKQEATDPPQANRRRQQKSFEMFKREFNDERPHEALGMKPPAKFYASSPRSYPSKLVDLEYPNGHLLRRVSAIGPRRTLGCEPVEEQRGLAAGHAPLGIEETLGVAAGDPELVAGAHHDDALRR